MFDDEVRVTAKTPGYRERTRARSRKQAEIAGARCDIARTPVRSRRRPLGRAPRDIVGRRRDIEGSRRTRPWGRRIGLRPRESEGRAEGTSRTPSFLPPAPRAPHPPSSFLSLPPLGDARDVFGMRCGADSPEGPRLRRRARAPEGGTKEGWREGAGERRGETRWALIGVFPPLSCIFRLIRVLFGDCYNLSHGHSKGTQLSK